MKNKKKEQKIKRKNMEEKSKKDKEIIGEKRMK